MMNIEQANELADLLKNSNKKHKSGHYTQGYTYLFFCKKRQLYCVHREEFGLNMYEPHHHYEYLDRRDFMELLMQAYNYESVKANL